MTGKECSTALTNRVRRHVRAFFGALALCCLFFGAASAANLDITVSISSTKSLTLGTSFYSFGAQSVNASVVSATSIDVTNASTALVESYAIAGADAPSTEGGTAWTLSTTPGVDAFALAAQFSASAPSNADASWASDDLNNSSAVNASDTVLGNGTHADAGDQVMPGAARKLWFRLKTPTAISDGGNHKASLTISVQ